MKYGKFSVFSIVFCLSVFFFGPAAWSQSTSARSDTASKSSVEEFRSVIMGFSGNRIEASMVAATISGGGRLGFPNRVYGDMGSVGGGAGNEAGSTATVAGGARPRQRVFSGNRARVLCCGFEVSHSVRVLNHSIDTRFGVDSVSRIAAKSLLSLKNPPAFRLTCGIRVRYSGDPCEIVGDSGLVSVRFAGQRGG